MRPSLLPVALAAAALATAATGTRADTLQSAWSVAPGDRTYVTTGNTERGVAFNPVSQKVLLLGRAGGPKIYVLDKADGSDGSEAGGDPRSLSLLDAEGVSPISGGTFTLNLVGAADDGAVYACNLATSLGTVRIYRWADDQADTPVSVAYTGDPLANIPSPGSGQDIRFGDNFAVRGSGPNTQLLQTARNGKYIVLYTTEDGVQFTSKVFVSPGTLQGKIGLGVTFGEGDTLWAKLNGVELHRIGFDLASSTATVLGTVPTSVVPAGVTGISVDPVAKRLAAVSYTDHTLSVFDVSDVNGFVRIGDPLPFPAANGNGNGTAAAAIRGGDVFGLDTNNGLLAGLVEKSQVADPPVITTQPAGVTVYEGAAYAFAVGAQGTAPFKYQWWFNDAPIPGATGAQLPLTGITTAQAGDYSVVVSNDAGSATSTKAALTVRTPLQSGILKPLWGLNPGDRAYVTTDNTQRGLAYNPATGNLLFASRSPSNLVAVLDAATGAEKHLLRTTGADDLPVFSGGTFPMNLVGVADDGVVYAGNLVTDGTAGAFSLYRWDSDDAESIPVPLGSFSELSVPERWGDTMDVRGAGATTQIVLGTRGVTPQEGAKFALLTTADGYNFSAQLFSPQTPEGAPVTSAAFGLGIAFGPGNTVFGTANGEPLVMVSFDPAAGSSTVLQSFSTPDLPTTISCIAFSAARNLLAGISLEIPDNVRLYDFQDAAQPEFVDQRLILPEQPNINGTGAVDFGGNRLFALDTNSGLRAYEVTEGTPAAPATLGTPAIANGEIRFNVTGTPGASYTVLKAGTVAGPWAELKSVTSPATVTDPASGGTAFYRAVAK